MQVPHGGEAEVVFIVGPTASGKTEAAVALAAALPGAEIVNCDSRQVYRGMSIGTAKPTASQRASVPHHVIDVVEPDDAFSLAAYLSLARSAIADILARGGRPVVVGGTGQYAWGLAGSVATALSSNDSASSNRSSDASADARRVSASEFPDPPGAAIGSSSSTVRSWWLSKKLVSAR